MEFTSITKVLNHLSRISVSQLECFCHRIGISLQQFSLFCVRVHFAKIGTRVLVSDSAITFQLIVSRRTPTDFFNVSFVIPLRCGYSYILGVFLFSQLVVDMILEYGQWG